MCEVTIEIKVGDATKQLNIQLPAGLKKEVVHAVNNLPVGEMSVIYTEVIGWAYKNRSIIKHVATAPWYKRQVEKFLRKVGAKALLKGGDDVIAAAIDFIKTIEGLMKRFP